MIKAIAATAAGRTGLARLTLSLRGLAPVTHLPVLTFHRAAPREAGSFDDDVVDSTPASFERHLARIVASSTPIDTRDLVAAMDGRTPLPRNPVMITFDDGYLDNHDVVLPLAKKYGAKIVFFIATSFLEERRLFWWDRVNYLVKSSRRPRIVLAAPYALDLPMGDPAEKGRAIRALLRMVKDVYALDLPAFLAVVGDACDVHLSDAEERELVDARMMTWDHVRALHAAGMDVQSHTRTHRVLQTLPDDRLADELVGAKAILEREIGKSIEAVSYPVGKPLASHARVRNAVRAAGYRLGFTNRDGINRLATFDAMGARRIALDPDMTAAELEGILALPPLAY